MIIISELVPLHREALYAAGKILDLVRPDDLADPTPCKGWDLRALLGHVIGQNYGFALAVEAHDAPRTAFASRLPDPGAVAASWQLSADRVAESFAAAEPGRLVRLVELDLDTRFPVETVIGFHLLDTVVHSWDVATTIGGDYRPAADLVEVTSSLARQVPAGPARTSPTPAFASALPLLGTDEWTDTLAHLGRRR